MVWQKGQRWRVAQSLDVLNGQIRAYAPRSVPPATDPNAWGSIADGEHSITSDHYPHYIAALGSTAVVTARDFPHAPALGLDFGVVAESLRRSRDPRIKYLIFNRRMFSSYATSSYPAFTWRPYSNADDDPHDDHGHVSVVSAAIADDQRSWALPGSGGTMALTSADVTNVWNVSQPQIEYDHDTPQEWGLGPAEPAELKPPTGELGGPRHAIASIFRRVAGLYRFAVWATSALKRIETAVGDRMPTTPVEPIEPVESEMSIRLHSDDVEAIAAAIEA
jgi:hypothetical protein